MNLRDLYNKLKSEGCINFYIDGIGGPSQDDVECLGLNNGIWEVYYIERGQKSRPSFTTDNMQEAIQYYHDYILNKEHWHIVVFTRSESKFNSIKEKIESSGIQTIQNDIPDYKEKGDRILRLFVVNKDIFEVEKIMGKVPYKDVL